MVQIGLVLFLYSCIPPYGFKPPFDNSRYVLPKAQGDPSKLLTLLGEYTYNLDEQKPTDTHLALLYKYSPDAYYILKISEEYLQDEIKIGGFQYAQAKNSENEGKTITTLQDGTKIEKIRRGKGYRRWIDYDKSFDDQVKSRVSSKQA